jgi:hypothetical protein
MGMTIDDSVVTGESDPSPALGKGLITQMRTIEDRRRWHLEIILDTPNITEADAALEMIFDVAMDITAFDALCSAEFKVPSYLDEETDDQE